MLSAIDTITGAGAGASTVDATGQLVLTTGTTQNLAIAGTGNALAALGLSAATTNVGAPLLSGETLTISATGGGTATSITFGTGQRPGLDAERAQHGAGGQQPAGYHRLDRQDQHHDLEQRGVLDDRHDRRHVDGYRLGLQRRRRRRPGSGRRSGLAGDPCQPGGAVQQRAAQINTTAQDSSFNGINLLNGDTLKLVFNETGKSTLLDHRRHLQRRRPRSVESGLRHRLPGQLSANKALTTLNAASTTLRSEASALGSNLSIVQIRQDFNKNLINVLQTGSSNLTLADTNEEAANSQALSTRQSIAVSALALANQSQAERAAAAALISLAKQRKSGMQTAGETPPFLRFRSPPNRFHRGGGGR